MKNLLKNDKLLYSLPWIYLITTIAYEVVCYFNWEFSFALSDILHEIINVAIVFCITISFKKHEKNIMKFLFGALMMGRVMYALNYVDYYFFGDYDSLVCKISSMAFFLLYLLFFFNHLLLGYGHKASPAKMKFNYVIGGLILVTLIVWNLILSSTAMQYAETVLAVISEAALVFEVLCIETKVDAYKLDREAAGWTQEKGYPEGYVHEYEKR